MTNASTIRLILAVSLAILLFAALPYERFDLASTAWADDDDDDDDDDNGKSASRRGGKESKSDKQSAGRAEREPRESTGSSSNGKESKSDKKSAASEEPEPEPTESTGASSGGNAAAAGGTSGQGASTDDAPEPTAASDETNDDDEDRRGSNFFVGLNAYEQGDFDLALSHWLPLAESGHAAAQTGLGAVYYGIEQHAAAFRWSRLAAHQGETDAAHNLAVLYQYGLGTPFSMSQAMLWYGEAASRGSRKATLALRELRGGTLASLVVPVPIPKPDRAESFALQRSTEEVQILLATLGYDPGPIDGRPGARTKAAVERFEQDRGLFVRGRVNETLLVNLRRAVVDDSATVISTR